MNRYYISINENRHGLYDFIIELLNENCMEEKAVLGNRENIDTLSECLIMLEEFPLSETSELAEVTFNRRNKFVKLNKLEQLFVDSVSNLATEKPIKDFKIN